MPGRRSAWGGLVTFGRELVPRLGDDILELLSEARRDCRELALREEAAFDEPPRERPEQRPEGRRGQRADGDAGEHERPP